MILATAYRFPEVAVKKFFKVLAKRNGFA